MLERRDCDPGGPRRSHRLPIAWRGGDSRTSSGRRSARASIPTIASSGPGPGRKSSASWNITSWRPRPFVNRSDGSRSTNRALSRAGMVRDESRWRWTFENCGGPVKLLASRIPLRPSLERPRAHQWRYPTRGQRGDPRWIAATFFGRILSCDPLSDADQAPSQDRGWACSVSLALKLAAAGRIRREA